VAGAARDVVAPANASERPEEESFVDRPSVPDECEHGVEAIAGVSRGRPLSEHSCSRSLEADQPARVNWLLYELQAVLDGAENR